MRSNFSLPAHDGLLHVGGAVENPTTLTIDDLQALPAVSRAVTLECAGNGRLDTRPLPVGEPWGGYAVSTAMWTGARLSDVLSQAAPRTAGVELRCEGADSGTYHLTPVLPEDPPLVPPGVRTVPHSRARHRSGGRHPDRLRDERRAVDARPRSAVPAGGAGLVRGGFGEVALAARCPHRALLRRVPDRDLHVPVARPRSRARRPDARPVAHHRSRARHRVGTGHAHDPGESLVRRRTGDPGGPELHRGWRVAPSGPPNCPQDRINGRTGRSSGPVAPADSAFWPAPPTLLDMCSPKCRPGTGSDTATTRSRSPPSMRGETAFPSLETPSVGGRGGLVSRPPEPTGQAAPRASGRGSACTMVSSDTARVSTT